MPDVHDLIDDLLDEIEGMGEDYAATHTKIALQMMDDDSPTSVEIVAFYLQWAISHRSIVEGGFKSLCNCQAGWLQGTDGGVKPCPRCNSESNEKWYTEYVDSDQGPQ